MDRRYHQFCMADPVFYDSPARAMPVDQGYLAGFTVPGSWHVTRRDDWTVLGPDGGELPAQGWKIHCSATVGNASEILGIVWDYCVRQGISFKFVTDQVNLLLRNSKYADRTGSGKFITMYPAGLGELERTLRELGARLDGFTGPYILSDLRWRSGPLFVRYGGFVERYCKLADGSLTPAISDPDGRLVPDVRQPKFAVPPWVEIPGFLTAAMAERASPTEFPFQIRHPLHFSNGGGIYLATDTRTGRVVVLKEARPLAGLDRFGADAVERLRRERDFLEKLAGTGVVPELYDYFVCWEHHFLVEEYVEGQPLGKEMVLRAPLIHPEIDEAEVADYTRWALATLDKVAGCLRVVHDAGIAFGDLHPHNVMLRQDGRVVLLDLEAASYLADEMLPGLGATGYRAPDGRRGAEADNYAMACMWLGLFMPLTMLFPLDRTKAAMLANYVVRRYPVPEQAVARVAEVLQDRRPTSDDLPAEHKAAEFSARLDEGAFDWPSLRDSIRDAVLASATPDRTDRLFPGDIEQFTRGGAGLAYGAAGVLYALARSGAGRFPDHEQWLLDAVERGDQSRIGFYDGLHGVAYALLELGRPDEAQAVLERTNAVPLEALPDNLFSGLSGVGLNLLRFAEATGDESFRTRALEAGTLLAEGTKEPPDKGLMFGPSGHALLFVRLFEATGEPHYLDLAEQALSRDVDRLITLPDGSMHVDGGWRAMPYLATGSIGVGFVLRLFLRHRENGEFARALALIRRTAQPELVIGSGLFNGRAGCIAFLSALQESGPVLDRLVRRLSWHIVPYRGNVAFPGDQLLRLSMDLATGSAGVLFALSSALDDNRLMLPFL
ncbi:class III lanthionine synthetase LanKC [Actinocrispum wychmicini]|uniref:non-specific serine/threonine protein kinase n=1 Tax=Actinocrispum wychmicini TaxID=1213861 RepID=A0A4R2JIG0_9PSEU|nr:class III lanthionine synthetase LanKC [Actinocrispum wychmicini]TCO59701.1 protein kinase-like protein [Actinocrispum wychmicini]